MKNLSPINESKDVVTKEYVDNATVASAEKLTSSAGSSTVPVYFEDGKPKVCAYTLGSMSKESASDYEKAAVIDEKFAAVKNDIAINRTTLGTQCKNLLKNTATTKTTNGITFTVNDDKSITVNGTNILDKGVSIEICGLTDFGNRKLTASIGTADENVYLALYNSRWSWIGTNESGVLTWDNKESRRVRLIVKAGATVNNVTVYPMIRYADIIDDTYEPYKESVDTRLTKNKSDIAVTKSTLGYQCKNLLKNNAVTQTVSGVTFTINDDKSITVNGTATAQISFMINNKVGLGIGNYILTGCPSGGSWNTFYLTAYASSARLKSPDFGSGCKIENKTVTQVVISIASGYTANNLKFYPMLRDADIIDDTFEPYQPSLIDRCLLKDTAGINLGHAQSDSITIDNLSAYTALWINVAGAVAGINFITNLIVPVAYLAKSTSNSVQLAGGIPSSAYTTSSGVLAAKNMSGYITAKVSGNTLSLTISDGIIGTIEVVSLM